MGGEAMNPTTIPDSQKSQPSAPADPSNDIFNPVLLRLKQEAEAEVKRLRTELAPVRDKLAEAEARKERIGEIDRKPFDSTTFNEKRRLEQQQPSEIEWAKLKDAKVRLEADLKKAEQRLETELAAIRQVETASTPTGGRVSRANRELTELLETAVRLLPEYAGKLDRIVERALSIWDRRDPVSNNLFPLLKTALDRLGGEFRGLSEPLKQWIHKFSAAYEEGRLTEIQRMELGLRLIDLETKFQTAQTILRQLGVL
jgi:hypothetical protein